MHEARSADPASAHLVGFYESDEQLVSALVRFLGAGLGAGESVVAVATRAHLRALERQLAAHGLDLARLRASGRYAAFDAERTLAELVHGEELDFERMRALMRQPIVFDGRNVFDPRAMHARGFTYFGIGRS